MKTMVKITKPGLSRPGLKGFAEPLGSALVMDAYPKPGQCYDSSANIPIRNVLQGGHDCAKGLWGLIH